MDSFLSESIIMARNTKAKAELTRQKILDSAEVLFSERGVSNTSLADIAAAAGVTRGAIYWHFKNKVDLFEAMHARVRLSVTEIESETMAAPDPVSGLRDYWIRSLLKVAHDDQRRRVIDILFRKCEYVDEYQAASARISEWGVEIVQAMTVVFAKAAEADVLPPDLSPHVAARATFSMVTGILFSGLTIPHLYVNDDDIIATVSTFFKALRR